MFEWLYMVVLLGFMLYALGVLAVLWTWYRSAYFQYMAGDDFNYIFFSILIPFRNESENLPFLIASLQALDYPQKYLEILLIDDHSEDGSEAFLKQVDKPRFKLITNRGDGKKSAIRTALQMAQGEYIIQTDADCCFDVLWLKTINAFLQQERQNKEVHLLAAPVLIKPQNSFLNVFQRIDFVGLQMVTLGLVDLKCPTMLNGANLIYNKSSWQYLERQSLIAGQESPSGDDTFLLYAVKKQWGNQGVLYLKSLTAQVETRAVETYSGFWQQRVRWASKIKYVKDKDTVITGIIVGGWHLAILILILMTIFNPIYLKGLMISLILKIALDACLFLPYARFFKIKKIGYYLPFFTIISYFYVFGVIIFSSFAHFKWKGRSY